MTMTSQEASVLVWMVGKRREYPRFRGPCNRWLDESSTQAIAFPAFVSILGEMQSEPPQEFAESYDVVVIGGALSGAATATLLGRGSSDDNGEVRLTLPR